MKYKQIVYTPIIIIIACLKFMNASEHQSSPRTSLNDQFYHGSKLERVLSMWNRSSLKSEDSLQSNWPDRPEPDGRNSEYSEVPNFSTEISKCIRENQYQITGNFTEGKIIILNCFKTILMQNMFKYLVASPDSSIKVFNGLLEFKKIPDWTCRGKGEVPDGREDCVKKYNRYFEQYSTGSTMSQNKKNEYIRLYKKAVQKLMSEKVMHQNLTEEERERQLNKINENSQAFLSEIINNLGDEDAEKVEEENLKREISDPKLMPILNAFTRNYMLKLKFYPGVSARMMRSHNGGVTFDLEISDANEELEEDSSSDEGSTREIKEKKPQAKDYFDDDSDEGGIVNKKKSKKSKKKKKEIKKKAKKLKKIIPYLLLPMLIQMTLLPFVFKKLFFLAMKALFAGKVALILIGFNLLRNTCIRDEDKYAQKIRVEHYGYNKGEEYGAWVNGRSIQEPSLMEALREAPFTAQKPLEMSS